MGRRHHSSPYLDVRKLRPVLLAGMCNIGIAALKTELIPHGAGTAWTYLVSSPEYPVTWGLGIGGMSSCVDKPLHGVHAAESKPTTRTGRTTGGTLLTHRTRPLTSGFLVTYIGETDLDKLGVGLS